MKLGVKFEQGNTKLTGLGIYLTSSVVNKLLVCVHCPEKWFDDLPERIREMQREVAERMDVKCWYWTMLAADPHSNTVTLTVPQFNPEGGKVLYGFDEYDERIKRRGLPAMVVSADLFESFDIFNPNTMVKLEEPAPAEQEKVAATE